MRRPRLACRASTRGMQARHGAAQLQGAPQHQSSTMSIAASMPPAGTGTPSSVQVSDILSHALRQLTIMRLHVERSPWPQHLSWSRQHTWASGAVPTQCRHGAASVWAERGGGGVSVGPAWRACAWRGLARWPDSHQRKRPPSPSASRGRRCRRSWPPPARCRRTSRGHNSSLPHHRANPQHDRQCDGEGPRPAQAGQRHDVGRGQRT